MTKRILCLIESLGPGGAERQVSSLAVLLKQQGCVIEVWYYVKKDFYLPYLQDNGVVGRYLPGANYPWRRFFVLGKHVKSFHPDTVISYSSSSSIVACMLRLLFLKFNLIVSERSTTQHIDIRERIKFFLYRWADAVVPNSQSQGIFIGVHFPKLKSKVNVINNFIDPGRFKPAENKQQSNLFQIIYIDILKMKRLYWSIQ